MPLVRTPLSQIQRPDFNELSDTAFRWLDLVRRYSVDVRHAEVTFNPASVAANTVVEQTVTVTGLRVGDIIFSIVKPTLTAGFGVLQGRVSADDTLAIQLVNASGAAIDAPSETYDVVYIKNSSK